MLLNKKCFKILFLYFNWGDRKCRGILYSRLLMLLNRIPVLQELPQLLLVIKNKSIDGISILSEIMDIAHQTVYFPLCIEKSFYGFTFFNSLVSTVSSLSVVFFWAYVEQPTSTFRRIVWYMIVFTVIGYTFLSLKEIIISDAFMPGWFIIFTSPIFRPIAQLVKLLFHMEKGNVSLLTSLIKVLSSALNVHYSYAYSKTLKPFVATLISLLFEVLNIILVLILPKKRNHFSQKPQKND
jgi:hypothetical protein